jgi:hypothetical protein
VPFGDNKRAGVILEVPDPFFISFENQAASITNSLTFARANALPCSQVLHPEHFKGKHAAIANGLFPNANSDLQAELGIRKGCISNSITNLRKNTPMSNHFGSFPFALSAVDSNLTRVSCFLRINAIRGVSGRLNLRQPVAIRRIPPVGRFTAQQLPFDGAGQPALERSAAGGRITSKRAHPLHALG